VIIDKCATLPEGGRNYAVRARRRLKSLSHSSLIRGLRLRGRREPGRCIKRKCVTRQTKNPAEGKGLEKGTGLKGATLVGKYE